LDDKKYYYLHCVVSEAVPLDFCTGMKLADFIDKSRCADISPVIDAYQHAVLGRFPRARYVVGISIRLILIPFSHLPEWLFDAVLRIVGLSLPVPEAIKKKTE
jgi:hypothetical protein